MDAAHRSLLAELFPELSGPDLDLLATSSTADQDIDNFLQSRLTPADRLAELRKQVRTRVLLGVHVFLLLAGIGVCKPRLSNRENIYIYF
jgi:hypothetical protein